MITFRRKNKEQRTKKSLTSLVFFLSSFFFFVAATPALAAYKYQGASAFPDNYPDCPTSCQSACGVNQKINNAGYCISVGSFCCEDKPQNTCLGTCVPPNACEVSTNGGCTGGLTCCGALKKTDTGTSQPSPTGQPTQQQDQTTVVSTEGKVCSTPAGVSFPCPLGVGSAENVSSLVGQIIRWFLGLIGALFFAMFVWGGVLYMTAGSSKRAEEGQKTLVNAAIGMAIVLFSYLLVAWVLDVIGAAIS